MLCMLHVTESIGPYISYKGKKHSLRERGGEGEGVRVSCVEKNGAGPGQAFVVRVGQI